MAALGPLTLALLRHEFAYMLLLDERLGCCGFGHGVVSPVSGPGLRHWQRWGLKLPVKDTMASSTLSTLRKMTGMDNVSKVSVLHIVKAARLELPFGPSANKQPNGGQVGEF